MKYMTVTKIVRRECERIEAATGDYPIDWLDECADMAVVDWTDEDGNLDYESIEDEIICHADNYIDFICKTYPERMRG